MLDLDQHLEQWCEKLNLCVCSAAYLLIVGPNLPLPHHQGSRSRRRLVQRDGRLGVSGGGHQVQEFREDDIQPDDPHVNDLSGRLHSDNLELAKTVFKLASSGGFRRVQVMQGHT